jgi:hypothetical protein
MFHREAAIAVLLAVATIAIGVYLSASITLVNKDAAHYIQLAKSFADDPRGVVEKDLPGYPFLIFVTHALLGLTRETDTIMHWIWSAQIVSLFCRVGAVLCVYGVGRMLTGRRLALWSAAVLIILPYPARMAVDVVREWPHLLFLSAGFCLVLYGALRARWQLFALAGLSAGVGSLFRIECVQVVLYGATWIVLQIMRTERTMGRPKLAAALVLLVAGYLGPVLPCAKLAGGILPQQRRGLLADPEALSNQTDNQALSHVEYAAGLPVRRILMAWRLFFERVAENLAYFFMAPFAAGIWLFYKDPALRRQRFFIGICLLFNIFMLTLFACWHEYISRRYVVPMIVLLTPCIGVGLQKIARGLQHGMPIRTVGRRSVDGERLWFVVMLVVGALICAFKLFSIERDKEGYREVARWLNEHTSPLDVIAVPDSRIAFYAERAGVVSQGGCVTENVRYVVRLVDKTTMLTEQADSNLAGLISRIAGPRCFDGSTGPLRTHLSLHGAWDITLSAWSCPRTVSQNAKVLSPAAWYNDYFWLGMKGGRWCAAMRWDEGRTFEVRAKEPCVEGQWYHLAARASVPEGKLYLYVNGVQNACLEIPAAKPLDNQFPWVIGGADPTYFEGAVDNVSIFDKGVSADAVAAMFKLGRTAAPSLLVGSSAAASGLVGNWRLNEAGAATWVETLFQRKMIRRYAIFLDPHQQDVEVVVFEVLPRDS